MTWALKGYNIEKLDREEELDYVEIRLQKLESKDASVRRKAAEALAPYVKEDVFIDEARERFVYQPPHPAQVISDGIFASYDKNVAFTGAQALGVMGPAAAPHASKCLGFLMSHTDDEVRWQTARSLGDLGPGAAQEAAAAMAKRLDQDEETSELIRFVTAKSLGLMGPAAAPHASSELAAALKDKDQDVQVASAEALAKMGAAAAPFAAKTLVKALLSGNFEIRRLAAKALASMGEASAEVAAYPMCRVLLGMQPCCPEKYHSLRLLRQEPPVTCSQCQAFGPFAGGTDYSCTGKHCNWHICKTCFSKLKHKDARMQLLAAEYFLTLNGETVQSYQVYLSRALGEKNAEVKNAEVKETVRKALQLAKCECALKGSMALYDATPDPCGQPDCKFCSKEVPQLEDATLEEEEEDGEEEEQTQELQNDEHDDKNVGAQANDDLVQEKQLEEPEVPQVVEEQQDEPSLETVFDDIKILCQGQETLDEEALDTREPTTEEVQEDKEDAGCEEATPEEMPQPFDEQPQLGRQKTMQEEAQEKWAGWVRDRELEKEIDKKEEQSGSGVSEKSCFEEGDFVEKAEDYIETPRNGK